MTGTTTVRLATAKDFRAFYGRKPPKVWLGHVAVRDGRAIAMGVVHWTNRGVAVANFDANEEVSAYVMHRTAVRTLRALKAVGEPELWVGCNDMIVGARIWLERLGFTYEGQLGVTQSRWVWRG